MSDAGEQPEPVTVEITVDASQFTEGLRRAQAAALFALHPELADLNDSLDNLYGGSFEAPPTA
jgi:hypothetical protein